MKTKARTSEGLVCRRKSGGKDRCRREDVIDGLVRDAPATCIRVYFEVV